MSRIIPGMVMQGASRKKEREREREREIKLKYVSFTFDLKK